MYALTGANGQLGRLVLHHLLTQVPADQIIATTRTPENLADFAARGVVVYRADFSDPATLPVAFAGATRLLIISTDVIGQRLTGHKAAIAAAREVGVQHLVYTSAAHADPESSNPLLADHGQTEAALAASGIPWTALRNSFYAESLKGFLSSLLANDQLLIPAGSARHSWVTREDCARSAVGALTGKLTTTGAMDVTGPEALTFMEVAQRFAQTFDNPPAIQVVPENEIINQLVANGTPVEAVNFTVGFAAWVAREFATTPANTVERATGTRPAPIDGVLRS